MNIDIWSDIMCPFCYIGKRNFEAALERFPQKEKVIIHWKSFQLDPTIASSKKTLNEYLSESKGWSLDHAREMNDHVTSLASRAGLTFRLANAVVANSFNAHRLVHLAEKHASSYQVQETLFRNYFTEGKDISDHDTLIAAGTAAGIERGLIVQMLQGDEYSEDVRRDIREAQRTGIRGVPFFLFDKRLAVSGAREPEIFLEAFNKAWKELEDSAANDQASPGEGSVCLPESECEEE